MCRTFSSLLQELGTEPKVTQELLRHSSITTTMNLYKQVYSPTARKAQSNVIEMVHQPKQLEAANSGK